MGISTSFIDFIFCPVCQKETRHYTVYGNGTYPRREAKVYCEKCGTVKVITKASDEDKWRCGRST